MTRFHTQTPCDERIRILLSDIISLGLRQEWLLDLRDELYEEYSFISPRGDVGNFFSSTDQNVDIGADCECSSFRVSVASSGSPLSTSTGRSGGVSHLTVCMIRLTVLSQCRDASPASHHGRAKLCHQELLADLSSTGALPTDVLHSLAPSRREEERSGFASNGRRALLVARVFFKSSEVSSAGSLGRCTNTGRLPEYRGLFGLRSQWHQRCSCNTCCSTTLKLSRQFKCDTLDDTRYWCDDARDRRTLAASSGTKAAIEATSAGVDVYSSYFSVSSQSLSSARTMAMHMVPGEWQQMGASHIPSLGRHVSFSLGPQRLLDSQRKGVVCRCSSISPSHKSCGAISHFAESAEQSGGPAFASPGWTSIASPFSCLCPPALAEAPATQKNNASFSKGQKQDGRQTAASSTKFRPVSRYSLHSHRGLIHHKDGTGLQCYLMRGPLLRTAWPLRMAAVVFLAAGSVLRDESAWTAYADVGIGRHVDVASPCDEAKQSERWSSPARGRVWFPRQPTRLF